MRSHTVMTPPRSEKSEHTLKEIAGLFKKARSFLVIPHVGIDGDDLGSMLALRRGLEKAGKKVSLLCHETIPYIFRFLASVETIEKTPPPEHFDCAIMMECTNPSRLPAGLEVKRHASMVVNLDHHPGNTMYGDMNYVDCKAAAVAEIVFDLLQILKIPLDRQMAEALYVAILTDTGSFQFANTSEKTHRIAAELMNQGIKVDDLARAIFRNSSYDAQKLKGEVLASMESLYAGRIIFCHLTQEMMTRTSVPEEEMQQLIEDLNVIRGSEVFVLFKEQKDGTVRVSLRAWRAPVNQVAMKHHGGGHALAAGCTLVGRREEVQAIILGDLDELLSTAGSLL
jgi:bifunctional oligoribonuclease and PAP phosphatase NrnA